MITALVLTLCTIISDTQEMCKGYAIDTFHQPLKADRKSDCKGREREERQRFDKAFADGKLQQYADQYHIQGIFESDTAEFSCKEVTQ